MRVPARETTREKQGAFSSTQVECRSLLGIRQYLLSLLQENVTREVIPFQFRRQSHESRNLLQDRSSMIEMGFCRGEVAQLCIRHCQSTFGQNSYYWKALSLHLVQNPDCL
jgi:hypothetical protein